ncbi:hypothetical protein N0V90_007880 [Kalmusia sp. IMI 367209]|nr:hypothetical protein N0V90_007880 [Kalmusia sp. IMI 367209]
MYTRTRGPSSGLAILLVLYLLIATVMGDWNYSYCSSQNTGSTSAFYWGWQSNGKCHDHCKEEGNYAFAVIQDKECWCSDYIPQEQADISECSETCPGFPTEKCGKQGQYYIYVELDGTPSGTAAASSPSSTKSQSQSQSQSSKPSSTLQTSTSTAEETSQAPSPARTSIQTVTEGGAVVTKTLITTPTNTALTETTGSKSTTNTGAIVGGVVGGIGILAAVAGGVLFFLWRRRKQQQQQSDQGGEGGEPGVHRYASTMSKAGLLRGEKEPQFPPPIATSFNKRQSRPMDQDSISPISASDRRNSSFRIDQRLNPSTLFAFDNSSTASVGSLDDSRDYHRTLNVRNPDSQ